MLVIPQYEKQTSTKRKIRENNGVFSRIKQSLFRNPCLFDDEQKL